MELSFVIKPGATVRRRGGRSVLSLNRGGDLRRMRMTRVEARLDAESVSEEDIKNAKELIHKWQNPPEEEYPAWLPQTIEYSVRCAQQATAFALMDSVTRISVDLPLGRTRRDGLKWSTLEQCLHESSVLAPHYCQAFKGASIRLILAAEPLGRSVEWLQSLQTLDEAAENPSSDEFDIVIIASATRGDADKISKIVSECSKDTAIVLFNCFIDANLEEVSPSEQFTPVYICRRYEGGAVLLSGHGRQWDCFAELSIFEFEHVSRTSPEWRPSCQNLKTALQADGITFDPLTRYYNSNLDLKSAGFWPFMIICFPEVLPLDESILPEPEPKPTKKRFGFF
ncbi:hypothetical protein NDN08_004428 [Rhodosorus marinus]|uniref:DUF1995 domain-containing protein n=1 Tax=Rhodosorus marinus TaxID=101924 RepID=A0AAV8UL90_9RHOD|nr:hypothetical protein NDN08_004428 [Rhodosorus marinus]